jgi:hypothetical protein
MVVFFGWHGPTELRPSNVHLAGRDGIPGLGTDDPRQFSGVAEVAAPNS